MKGMSPLLKLLLGILALFAMAILVQHIFRGDESAFRDTPRDPQLLLKGVSVVGWNHGHRLWRFSSDALIVDHQGRFLTYRGKGVGEMFHGGKPFITVWAPRIRFDMLSKSVQASGGVFLRAKPDTELMAQELYWNQFSQRLYVPGKVYVQSPYGEATAHHLILVAYEGRLRVLGVHMTVDPRTLKLLKGKSSTSTKVSGTLGGWLP